jgi:hypothetical protein
MSAKKDRIIRKRYQQAADIYWTKDMEKILRRTRRELFFWRRLGPCFFIAGIVAGYIGIIVI